MSTNPSSQQVSELVEILHKSIIQSTSPKHVEYAEAIFVLQHMHVEYIKVQKEQQTDIPEEFVSEEEFPSLWGNADYMKELQEKKPETVKSMYHRCASLYDSVRKIVVAQTGSVQDKIRDVDALISIVRTQAEGRPLSIMSYVDRFPGHD
ncbi:hypothetical protein ACFL0V_05955 [Nanoarchaeota archaeon]